MKTPFKVFRYYTAILISFFFFSLLFLIIDEFNNEFLFSAVSAVFINLLNILIWYITLIAGIEKSNKIFLKWIFGGMLVRFLILLPAVYISIKFLNINTKSFILVFLINYIISLFIEIYSLAKFKMVKNN